MELTVAEMSMCNIVSVMKACRCVVIEVCVVWWGDYEAGTVDDS